MRKQTRSEPLATASSGYGKNSQSGVPSASGSVARSSAETDNSISRLNSRPSPTTQRGIAKRKNFANGSISRNSNGTTSLSNNIEVQIAPQDVLKIVTSAQASDIDVLSVRGEVRFVKFAGKTQYLDISKLDEETQNKIYKKLNIEKEVASGVEVKKKALALEKKVVAENMASDKTDRASLKKLILELQLGQLTKAVNNGDGQTASYYLEKLNK